VPYKFGDFLTVNQSRKIQPIARVDQTNLLCEVMDICCKLLWHLELDNQLPFEPTYTTIERQPGRYFRKNESL